jgi:hypothetical protein
MEANKKISKELGICPKHLKISFLLAKSSPGGHDKVIRLGNHVPIYRMCPMSGSVENTHPAGSSHRMALATLVLGVL